jgi:hypothetical protein
MPPKLSPRTKQLVELIFSPAQVDEAVHWLEEECGNNLPLCQNNDAPGMERIRFAALKLSDGNMLKLLRAIDEARMDWRDLIMAEGFGTDLNAHQKWADIFLNKT